MVVQPIDNQPFPDPPAREEEILEHALDLVRESGLRGLTMKKVADRVGFTETAAYRYFPTKMALVQGIMRRLFIPFLGMARSIAADADKTAAERLERVAAEHVDLIVRTDGLPVLVLAEACATGDEELLAQMREGVGAYLGLLETLLSEVTPPDARVRAGDKAMVLFGISTVVAVRRRLGLEPDMGRVRSDLVPFVVRSLTTAEDAR
jgi:AcrR family transcriptional regulator